MTRFEKIYAVLTTALVLISFVALITSLDVAKKTTDAAIRSAAAAETSAEAAKALVKIQHGQFRPQLSMDVGKPLYDDKYIYWNIALTNLGPTAAIIEKSTMIASIDGFEWDHPIFEKGLIIDKGDTVKTTLSTNAIEDVKGVKYDVCQAFIKQEGVRCEMTFSTREFEEDKFTDSILVKVILQKVPLKSAK